MSPLRFQEKQQCNLSLNFSDLATRAGDETMDVMDAMKNEIMGNGDAQPVRDQKIIKIRSPNKVILGGRHDGRRHGRIKRQHTRND